MQDYYSRLFTISVPHAKLSEHKVIQELTVMDLPKLPHPGETNRKLMEREMGRNEMN